jgi:predicted membrane-bound spermidine synthase
MAEGTRPTHQDDGVSAALLVQVAGRAPHPLMVRTIAFVVGAASLGTEIAAARLLAPYFGASTIIWANTIATVLVALSVGYWLGGKLADRRADLRGLCAVVMVASLLLALVPFVADPFLRLSVSALGSLSVGGFAGSLAAVLVLVAVPVMLLGTVAPYVSRLSVRSVTETGRTIGNLYAISTVGSLVGTFLASLLLIPVIGTHRTFIVFALALAVVSVPGLGLWRFWIVPLAVGGALAIPPAAIGAGVAHGRVIYATETQYQYARVVQFPSGVRWLQLNEGVAVHSLYRPGTFLTRGYWDDFLVLPFAARPGTPGGASQPPRRIAILGDAAGSVARGYGHFFPTTRVDAVEIDEKLTEIGKRYFHLSGPRLHLYTADARPWLQASHAHYDAIFLDAYRQPYIPFYLSTREFFELAADRLAPGGRIIINVGHPERSDALEKVLTATMREAFASVVRVPSEATNTILVGGDATLTPASLRPAARLLPPDLQPRAQLDADLAAPGLRGGAVYTDDKAPVEWLVDASLLQVAEKGQER